LIVIAAETNISSLGCFSSKFVAPITIWTNRVCCRTLTRTSGNETKLAFLVKIWILAKNTSSCRNRLGPLVSDPATQQDLRFLIEGETPDIVIPTEFETIFIGFSLRLSHFYFVL